MLTALLIGEAVRAETLSDYLRLAEEGHPRLAAARADVEAARAAVASETAAWFPSVSLGPAAYISSVEAGATRTHTRAPAAFSASLEQRLWDFGRTRASTRAALRTLAGQLAALAGTLSEIQADVVEKYMEAVLAQRMEALGERTLADRLTLRGRVERLVESGVRPRSDLTRADIDVENARVEASTAMTRRQTAREALLDAAGVDGDDGDELDELLDGLPEMPATTGLEEAALVAKPEMQGARFGVEAAQAELQARQREWRPVLSFSAASEFGERDIETTTGDVTEHEPNDNFNGWSVKLSLGWSGLNAASTRAGIRSDQAAKHRAEAELNELTRTTRRAITVAIFNLEESVRRLKGAERVLEAAAENHRLILRRYDSGVSTILDVTDGQVRLTEAEAAVLRARADVWIGNARLRRAAALPQLR